MAATYSGGAEPVAGLKLGWVGWIGLGDGVGRVAESSQAVWTRSRRSWLEAAISL